MCLNVFQERKGYTAGRKRYMLPYFTLPFTLRVDKCLIILLIRQVAR